MTIDPTARTGSARNLEYKCRLAERRAMERDLRELGARFSADLWQRDTYLHIPPPERLKVREQHDGTELIRYTRDEHADDRISRYTRTVLTDPTPELDDLKRRYGVRGIVVKQRHLWLFENARIHLDAVEGLGCFFEVEVVEPSSLAEANALLSRLLIALRLETAEPLRLSYIDLVARA